MNAEYPVFVVGAMRSGTTLMRLMLNRHSQVAIPPETHFLAALFGRFGPTAVLSGADLDEALEMVVGNEEWKRDWQSDPIELAQRVRADRDVDLADFIDAVFRLEIAPTGKPRWGSKTPAHLFQVRRLRTAFPNARFIALVRDPRDAYLSLAPRDWVGTSTWEIGSYLRRCGRMIKRFTTESPDSFMAVRYEDLVLEPERSLEQICRFVDLPYETSMREFHVDATDHVLQWEIDSGAHGKLLRPPSASDVDRWRREGAARDLREVEAVTFDALEWFDYERTLRPSEVRILRSRSRARSLASNPRGAVRSVRARLTSRSGR